MSKENCKYWDKCYQTNEAHLQKFNHPPKSKDQDVGPSDRPFARVAPKRRYSSSNSEAIVDTSNDLLSSSETTSNADQNIGMEEENNSGEERSSSTDLEDENGTYETAELGMEAMGRIGNRNFMGIRENRIRLSVQNEYEKLCETPEFIRHYFLVRMPKEFFDFWKFLNTHKEGTTDLHLLDYMLNEYDLQLVGPFEYMGKRFHGAKIYEPGFYMRHWRFYYDPPEFQTVFVRRGTGIHYGYWRDDPKEDKDLLIARNDAGAGCEFEFIGGNMFEAFTYFLQKDCPQNPFMVKKKEIIQKLMSNYLTENEIEKSTLEKLKKDRNAKVVAKTFHRAGIVVNYDRSKQVGYRPLLISEAELKKILKPFDLYDEVDDEIAEGTNRSEELKKSVLTNLQPTIAAASIALDEGDYGTALELGIDLFASGHEELHMVIGSLLVPTYSVLKRPQFIAINKAHMDLRRRGFKLSMFEV